jgi:hypothetical protein
LTSDGGVGAVSEENVDVLGLVEENVDVLGLVIADCGGQSSVALGVASVRIDVLAEEEGQGWHVFVGDGRLDQTFGIVRVGTSSEKAWEEMGAVVADCFEERVVEGHEVGVCAGCEESLDKSLAIITDSGAEWSIDVILLGVGISAVSEEDVHSIGGICRSGELENSRSAAEVSAVSEESFEDSGMVHRGPEHNLWAWKVGVRTSG